MKLLFINYLLNQFMVNKDSYGYRIGRLIGKAILLTVGYLVGKRWGRKPMDKSFPENPSPGGE